MPGAGRVPTTCSAGLAKVVGTRPEPGMTMLYQAPHLEPLFPVGS